MQRHNIFYYFNNTGARSPRRRMTGQSRGEIILWRAWETTTARAALQSPLVVGYRTRRLIAHYDDTIEIPIHSENDSKTMIHQSIRYALLSDRSKPVYEHTAVCWHIVETNASNVTMDIARNNSRKNKPLKK